MSRPGLLLVPEDGSEEEDDAFTVHLHPRSSPTPRRRDTSPEAAEAADEAPGRRKVRFADACGRQLERWHLYWPQDELPAEEEGPKPRGYRLLPDFQAPGAKLLLQRVQEQGVEVEWLRPVEGEPLSVRALARVLNVSYRKTLHARATLDGWLTHYDHPAAYVGSTDGGLTDTFTFVLAYPRSAAREGARLHFALRYEAGHPPAVRWANNGGRNYALVCEAEEGGEEERRQGSAGSAPPGLTAKRPGCLKPPSLRYWTRDEDKEDQDTGILDWTHAATPPSSSDLQIPKVQVSQLLMQPRSDRRAECPPALDEGAQKPPASSGDPECPSASEGGVENSSDGDVESPPDSDGDAESPPATDGDAENPPASDMFTPPSDRGIERPPLSDRGMESPPLSDGGAESPPPSDVLPPPSGRRIERPPPSDRVKETPPPSNGLPPPSERGTERPMPSDNLPSDWRETSSCLEPPGEQPEPSPRDLASEEALPQGVGRASPWELDGPSVSPSPPAPVRTAVRGPPEEGDFRDPGSEASEAAGEPQASPCPGTGPWPRGEEGWVKGAGIGSQGEVGNEPDLEALATLREVATLTSRWVQALVFMRVAAYSAGSLLWCTLYLLSILLP